MAMVQNEKMERAVYLPQEELNEFIYLKKLLSGSITPSGYMEKLVESFEKRKRQKDFFYVESYRAGFEIEVKLKKIREEISSLLHEKHSTLLMHGADTRLIYDCMLVAEAREVIGGSYENLKRAVEIRIAGFNLNINNEDQNTEIGIIINDRNNFCFFYRNSLSDTAVKQSGREYTNYYEAFRMNSYDMDLASKIINSYKEASLVPQPNGIPPHKFNFPNF